MTIGGPTNLPPDSYLHQKTARRRSSTGGYSGARVLRRRGGAPAGKWSRPGTPLVSWKFENGAKSPEVGREVRRRFISARVLGGVVWRLHLPEATPSPNQGGERLNMAEKVRLGFEHGANHVGLAFLGCQKSKAHGYRSKELMRTSPSVTGPGNNYARKLEPLFKFPDSVMEGATKWNPVNVKTSDKVGHVYGCSKYQSQPVHDNSTISALKFELEKAHERIYELETEKRYSKTKLKLFLKKLSEDRAAWRSREHEKIRAIIDDAKADLRNERKIWQRLELVNSKLVNEVEDAKLLAKRYMQDCEKERKARELTEEVCDELAYEIGENKAEVEALKKELMKMREEVDNDRRMLQMAEVWREERVQMKLIDAKVMIEERYTYMKELVANVEAFLNSSSSISDADISKAEIFQQVAALVNVQDIKDFIYEPSHPDDTFSVLEDVDSGNAIVREIEPCKNMFNKDKVIHHCGKIDESKSVWETVSQVEDQDSSSFPKGSNPSVNKKFWRN